jgi:acetylcholinesterase/cholinesterase
MRHYLLLLVAICCLSALAFGSDENLLVATTQGKVLGHYTSSGIREWKGIPYATPPVGDLRWEYPQQPSPYSSEYYEATFDAPGCIQDCKLPPGNCPDYGTSEDCLYMTIYAPAKPSTDPKGYPVFFWIHGGAFEQGLGNCALYNGTTFAQQDIITVVINYRLGVMGFMASENMDGNYGIMDQVLALKWVSTNIANFGGDPSSITIGGQSAGGMSVAAHLVSSESKGLFVRAVMESNPLALPFHTRESAAVNAKKAFEYLDCTANDVACMRTKTPAQIMDAQENSVKLNLNNLLINFLPFAPLVEATGVIPEQPLSALAKGNFNQVPLLSGSMYDEGQLFVNELFTSSLSKIKYDLMIRGTFGKSADAVLDMYPFDLIPDNKDGRAVLNYLATDLLFLCPLRNITVGYQAALGASIPTYIYRFKHILSFDAWGPDYSFCVGYVCHGSELPFVFNVFTDGVSVFYNPTADETQLALDLGSAWANFIKSGAPTTGLPLPSDQTYPVYLSAQDTLQVLEEPTSFVDSKVRDSFCDGWDKLGYYY